MTSPNRPDPISQLLLRKSLLRPFSSPLQVELRPSFFDQRSKVLFIIFDGFYGGVSSPEVAGIAGKDGGGQLKMELNWDHSFVGELPGDLRFDTIPRERLLGIKMATFKLHLVCRWNPDDFEVYREMLDLSGVESSWRH